LPDAILDVAGVEKDYRGLRPLRVRELTVHAGQHVALLGFDQAAAEVFVNLVTGATVPDRGEVKVFGTATSAIADADAWLTSLDRFGIISERAVLLDALTVVQNLAMPSTLEVDPVPDTVRAQVASLAHEVGLPDQLDQQVGNLSAPGRLRVRLGRALALNPAVVIAEHPNAMLPPEDVPTFAADFRKIIATRGIASVTLTADRTFAAAVAEEVFTLQPATGELRSSAGWRRWFGG